MFNVGDRIKTGTGYEGIVISLKSPAGATSRRMWFIDISSRKVLHTAVSTSKLIRPAASNKEVLEAMEIATKKRYI